MKRPEPSGPALSIILVAPKGEVPLGPLGVLFMTIGVDVEAILVAAVAVTMESLLIAAFVEADGASSSEERVSEARDANTI